MESISIALGSRQDISIKELLKLAKEADDLGYTGCFVGESWGMDAFTTLSAIASCTKNICVGTGIVPIFSRTPSLLAQSIASLDIISQGRAILGLGTSGRRVIEDWHGMKYERPIERSKEYLEIIRIALNNSPVNYNGKIFQTNRFKLAISPVQKNIPLSSGLGGGSSNAAATILALNKLWNLDLPKESLMQIGMTVGSDVGYFIQNSGAALVTGKGEKIQPLNRPPTGFALIITSKQRAMEEKTKTMFSLITSSDFIFELISSPQAPIFRTGAAPTEPGIKVKFSKPSNSFFNDHKTTSFQFSPAPIITSSFRIFFPGIETFNRAPLIFLVKTTFVPSPRIFKGSFFFKQNSINSCPSSIEFTSQKYSALYSNKKLLCSFKE